MATVTKKFRDDFEVWAEHRIATGEWTQAEMDAFKEVLRIDLTPGPDQLRKGLLAYDLACVERPAIIDDHEERYRLWANFFAAEAEEIRLP